MHYLTELRAAWRPLAAATIGMATGVAMAGPVTSTLAPSLVRDNHWSSVEFALVGSLSLVTSFAFPVVGRLADVIGVRSTALIGLIAMPIIYLAFSLMSGALWVYMVIYFLQGTLCVATSSLVYTRLVVQHVDRARGLALAIAASGPAVTGIVGGPILNAYVEAHGWRDAYQALAIFATIAGLLTFLLIPRGSPAPATTSAPRKRSARQDYWKIFRQPSLWLLIMAMLLCNLPATIMLVQLKMLLLANGMSGTGAGPILAVMSIGMLAGRFVAGIGLDRFRADFVSFTMLAIPSAGLFLIASPYDAPAVLTIAVFCIGFSFGAEGDIVAFLVARQFGVEIYGTVMGLITFTISFSAAAGAALLSATLASTGGYDLYLTICGLAVLIGAALLLPLGRFPATAPLDRRLEPGPGRSAYETLSPPPTAAAAMRPAFSEQGS